MDENIKLERARSPLLDKMLGAKISVLGKGGFVRVIDYMGNDEAIVQAARISYGSGTKHTRSDEKLIHYLIAHEHTSPLEMCEIKLNIRCPMDVWRQWIRHRTANVNEYSTRYSEAIDDMHTTDPRKWRTQAVDNKQGSGLPLNKEAGEKLTEEERHLHGHVRKVYKHRLKAGVAREQARKDLPLSTYTEAYWKIDLKNLLHFLKLRMHPAAQQEIRAYASVIGECIVAVWCPMAYHAWHDCVRSSVTLTGREQFCARLVASGEADKYLGATAELSERGKKDLANKLVLLGLTPPRRKDESEAVGPQEKSSNG